MALLKILALALLFAFCRRVHVGAADDCQLCITTADITKNAGYVFNTWDKLVHKPTTTKLCMTPTAISGGIKNEDGNAVTVTAHLQVLVYNPTWCYFQFMFGNTVSAANCLVSGYNISGGHYTQGHCTAVGELKATEYLTVKIGGAQGTTPCQLRANSFLCLAAST